MSDNVVIQLLSGVTLTVPRHLIESMNVSTGAEFVFNKTPFNPIEHFTQKVLPIFNKIPAIYITDTADIYQTAISIANRANIRPVTQTTVTFVVLDREFNPLSSLAVETRNTVSMEEEFKKLLTDESGVVVAFYGSPEVPDVYTVQFCKGLTNWDTLSHSVAALKLEKTFEKFVREPTLERSVGHAAILDSKKLYNRVKGYGLYIVGVYDQERQLVRVMFNPTTQEVADVTLKHYCSYLSSTCLTQDVLGALFVNSVDFVAIHTAPDSLAFSAPGNISLKTMESLKTPSYRLNLQKSIPSIDVILESKEAPRQSFTITLDALEMIDHIPLSDLVDKVTIKLYGGDYATVTKSYIVNDES